MRYNIVESKAIRLSKTDAYSSDDPHYTTPEITNEEEMIEPKDDENEVSRRLKRNTSEFLLTHHQRRLKNKVFRNLLTRSTLGRKRTADEEEKDNNKCMLYNLQHHLPHHIARKICRAAVRRLHS